jgi:hypothetical protein
MNGEDFSLRGSLVRNPFHTLVIPMPSDILAKRGTPIATTALDERFHNSRTSGTSLGVEPRERSTAPHAP